MFRVISLVIAVLFLPQFSAVASGKVTEVDLAAAKALYDKGVVFIDARRQTSYRRAHIKGAHNMFYLGDEFVEKNLTALVGKDQPVVFYCNCSPSCNISPAAASFAKKMGYQDVYYFKAAMDRWSIAGYPIEKSE